MVRRNYVFDTIRNVYLRYGYLQIETPSMENLSTLEGKYGEEGDKLLFRILNSGINYPLIRYADVLLMNAEAKNELGKPAEAAALIQQVRDRATLPDREAEFAALSKEQMRDRIAHERLMEFAIEGSRINDIIRWDWFNNPAKVAELKAHDPEFANWTPGKEYLPIPQIELHQNIVHL